MELSAVSEKAASLEGKLISLRRDFHKHPESGWTEFRTSSIIAERLKELGFDVKTGDRIIKRSEMMGVPGPEELMKNMERALSQGADPSILKTMEGGLTGVVGEINSGQGPVVALRFDIDANDLQEAQDDRHRPFREGFSSLNPGVMHACGHDGHVAIGLGVAEVLSSIRENLKGTVRLIFEPGEEGSRGAAPMAAAGALKDVNYIIGGHIGFQARKTGALVCGTGRFLATTKFDVKFTGSPSHSGAAPQKGRNALLAAACAVMNLHAIPRHGEGISRVTVGTLEAGQARNIIPPNAFMRVETRGETTAVNDCMFESAKRVIECAARMYDVSHEVVIVGQTSSGKSSPDMIEKVRIAASKINLFKKDEIVDYLDFGGTDDFSHLMSLVQKEGGSGTYLMIGSELASGHHDFYFDFDERVLAPGVELFVRVVLDILG